MSRVVNILLDILHLLNHLLCVFLAVFGALIIPFSFGLELLIFVSSGIILVFFCFRYFCIFRVIAHTNNLFDGPRIFFNFKIGISSREELVPDKAISCGIVHDEVEREYVIVPADVLLELEDVILNLLCDFGIVVLLKPILIPFCRPG